MSARREPRGPDLPEPRDGPARGLGRSAEGLELGDGSRHGHRAEALEVGEGPGPGRGPEGLDLREGPEGLTLRVRVQPRASRDAIGGEREGALVVRLTAPPVEGAANKALARLLGRALGVAPSAVRIVGGASGRLKRVAISGIDIATARERLDVRLGG